jgi:hypothetical protein
MACDNKVAFKDNFGRVLSPRGILCLGLIYGLLSSTAMADITRHCNAEVRITEYGSPDAAIFHFTVHGNSSRTRAFANSLRNAIRNRIQYCMRDHWHIRNNSHPPRTCEDGASRMFSYDFIDYPFNNMNEDVIRAMCPEPLPPGSDPLVKHVDIMLTVSGKMNCDRTASIARNVAITCPQAVVTLERIDSQLQPAGSSNEPAVSNEQPVIGDGGGFECVGAGCGGAAPATEEEPPVEEAEEPAAEEQPADDGLPATASYNLLPHTRLPGNDLRLIEMSSPNWMLCRQACTDDERCRAFTYRAPNANSGPLCLLKSRGGIQIPGTCCQSGIKN